MMGQEILRSLQEDIDKKKEKFIKLMREFHSRQPLDKEMQDEMEKARVDWLISINHLKASLPFLGAKEFMHSLLISDKEVKKV
ncbi:MAG: hypothetical protein JWQ25_2845 [Daejeonella sp.]|nr:hypothetical protein [Daejeonella sp.]